MESNNDLIKAVILAFVYFVLTPALGFVLKGHRPWQRAVFAVMCFMTISGFWSAGEWGLALGYLEDYRGHTRGFHFFFNEALAGALIIANFLESPRRFKWFPPGLLLYLLYILLSMVSIINAPTPVYVWMAAWKSLQVIVIFVAAYNFFQNTADVRLFLTTFVVTMLWELVAVLKLKYLDHKYQVAGTFEHQNALAMYANMIGLLFLSAATGPKQPRATFWLVGFLACVWIVECTLSRGGLSVLAMGIVCVMVLSLLEKLTARRIAALSGLAIVAGAGMIFSFQTVVNRFNDSYNQDSAESRRLLNIASRKMLVDFPLGIGWNNFGQVINPPWHYGDLIDNYVKSHGEGTKVDTNKGIVESHYYLLLAENGYEGLFGYLLFIGFFLWLNLRAALYFRDHFLGAVSLGIAMGCLSNYAQSFLERVLTQPRNMMLWLLLLALAARIDTWRRQVQKKRRIRVQASPPVRRELQAARASG